MDRLLAMRVFTSVVETGSFARASEQLHISATATSRHVAELEKHLGAQLLQRSTRHLSLTEIGANYYDRCRVILADVDEAETQAATQESQPRGVLRLSLPHGFGLRYIAPLIPEFCRRYPDLKIELNFSDQKIDLIEEGIDMAVRITGELKTTLVARKLATAGFVCCASPSYLKAHGTPQRPEDLQQHNCLLYSYSPTGNLWTFLHQDKPLEIQVKGSISTNSGDMNRLAAINGLGLAVLPTFVVCEELRSGQLQQVLGAYPIPNKHIYVVYLPSARRSARVRAMTEFLWEALGKGTPSWQDW